MPLLLPSGSERRPAAALEKVVKCLCDLIALEKYGAVLMLLPPLLAFNGSYDLEPILSRLLASYFGTGVQPREAAQFSPILSARAKSLQGLIHESFAQPSIAGTEASAVLWCIVLAQLSTLQEFPALPLWLMADALPHARLFPYGKQVFCRLFSDVKA